MTTIQQLSKEMEQESETTRKMLSRVPNDKYDWQPHPKSMTIRRLATHIADLPSWVGMTMATDELDFAKNPYKEEVINTTPELLSFFEKRLKQGRADLADADEKQLEKPWTLRNGEQIYSVSTKGEIIRMTFCQIVHHRAQLGVYLRLLDVPIPGSYGPSADEPSF